MRMHADYQIAMNSVDRIQESRELDPERYGHYTVATNNKTVSESLHIHTYLLQCNNYFKPTLTTTQ
jgi:hypothetical protein